MSRRQRRANLMAILIGLVATAAVVAAYLGGVLERLELITLDLRFRYANSIKQRADIVCIDIDDTSLEVVGRWPWPRDLQAPLVSIPAELGARAILVDLTWSEPESVRSVTTANADVFVDPLKLTTDNIEKRYPDYELRAAIAEAGNVYLAYDYADREIASAAEFNAAVDALQRNDEAGARRWLELLRQRRGHGAAGPGDSPIERQFDLARIVAALETRPTLEEEELADRLGIPLDDFLGQWFERCRKAALVRLTRRWLDAAADRWQADPFGLFRPAYEELTGRPFRGDTPLKRALQSAFCFVLGYEATTRNRLVSRETVEPVAARIEGITPVYFLHARAAKRCGFVNFLPDVDGVVRRVPLLGQDGQHAQAQVAFALACDELGLTGADFVVAGRELTLRGVEGSRASRTIQLDEQGRTLVPWVRGRRWDQQFTHIPADAVWSLFDRRRDLEHNRKLVLEALAAILSDERFSELAHHRQAIAELLELEAQILKERYRGNAGDVAELTALRDALEAEIKGVERLVRQRAAAVRKAFVEGDVSADDPASREFAALAELFQLIDDCRRVAPGLQDEINQLAARIRGIVAGKICLIGYTATSLADMKPIPTSESAPGVMTHANLLNGLLSGRLVHWASTPVNVAIAVALGGLISLISVRLTPRLAILLVLFAVLTYLALAGVVAFFNYTYWIALTPAVAAMVVPFFVITVFRYVYIDSERRQLATALGQYTTKEIARQMAEDPELCQRAETREVTAMFTDLKGFTTISERIGAERTQQVLNVCLGCFTEVMLRHEGMVNKFIGDGVFVFWNPVIYPQRNHALRACETGVDLLAALEALKVEQAQRGGDDAIRELVVRVGLATGNAIVGPCGSEQKYDYTCIGDSVNVAARLESANKFYGTQILLSDATRAQVGQAFEFRPLGAVRVKGRRQAVPIYELLGRTGQVSDDRLDHARVFAEAVTLFQQRQWRAALEAFASCQQRRPDDLAAENYIEATASLLAKPPEEDWTGALELREK